MILFRQRLVHSHFNSQHFSARIRFVVYRSSLRYLSLSLPRMANSSSSTPVSTSLVGSPSVSKNTARNNTTISSSSSSSTVSPSPDIEDLYRQVIANKQEYYTDPLTGYLCYTELFHRKRGNCCGNGCRHCPYNHCNVPEEKRKFTKPPLILRKENEQVK